MCRPFFACACLCLSLTAFAGDAAKKPRQLPGVVADGSVTLPNSWSIRPAGKQIELGDFPVNIALHPRGTWAAVLHAGYRDHEIILVDLGAKKPNVQEKAIDGIDVDVDLNARKARVVSRVVLEQTFGGLAFSPDGNFLYAGGGEFDVVHQFQFDDGFLTKHRQLKVADEKFIPGGLAIHPDGKTLYVPGTWGHAVCVLPIDDPKARITIPLGKDSHPFACIVDAKGKRLFVSLWNQAAVAVVDLDQKKVVQTIATEKHPTEMILGPGEKTLFVACANSTRVSVIDVKEGKGLETINCALYATAPNGNTPNSLSLTPDGQILFVANADNNNLALFNVEKAGDTRPLGFIPVGIYPTSVRYNPADKRIYVANGRGTSVKANTQGPNPTLPKNPTVREYIAGLYRGTLTIVDMPNAETMIKYSKQAYKCSPLREDQGTPGPAPKGSPVPARIGGASPIKYCIYVIRENRTYDQVFGDIKEGNGDPSMCIFPKKITPNAHRLAQQFVLLDNFYCDGEVSADGHEWSMGAYCTDFVKRVWPLSYRGSPLKKLAIYPSEGLFDDLSRPAGGYIWDRCAEAKISYRSYGEWIANGKTLKDPGKARVKALEGHFDPWFRGYDLDYPDVQRAARFLDELKRFEKEGDMPRLQIVRLPNDHTYGTKAGKPTPTAMVAENDLALGLFVEGVSKSKFWNETAIFIIEDDAQNGSDHVDAHRTVALCISPYTQSGKVDSTMYSTASMLRTMELILGLRPMSQFDAAATPMYNAFQNKPKLDGYTHVVPAVNMKAVNLASAYGSKLAETWDFSKEDAIDDLIFNEVIWRSVRGPGFPMPPPVRAAFVFPHLPKD